MAKWIRIVLLAFSALLLLLSALAGGLFLYAGSKLNRIQYEPPAASPPVTVLPLSPSSSPEEPPSGDIINILLLGTDMRLPGTSDPGRADVTMLCSLDPKAGTIKLVSFERGIYVPIPGREDDLLTHAYHWGGAELSQSIISQCFSLELAGYAQVDFEAFVAIVDGIGGVDLELTAVEAAALSRGVGSYGLSTGTNHLNGREALYYCRLRAPDDDWQRQQRQRNCITACVHQIKDLNLSQWNELADTILPYVHTNLSRDTLLSLLLQAPKLLGSSPEQLQVPDKNASFGYIACDFEYEHRKISNFLYGTDYELRSPY